VPKKGFTFGNPRLFQLRRYYHGWIERTLMKAYNVTCTSQDKLRILQLKNCIYPAKIEDEGRLPFSRFQKSGKKSTRPLKVPCLLAVIRNFIISRIRPYY